MCRTLKVSRAGYYAWVDRPPSAHADDDRRLAVLVRQAHAQSGNGHGAPRVQKEMAARKTFT